CYLSWPSSTMNQLPNIHRLAITQRRTPLRVPAALRVPGRRIVSWAHSFGWCPPCVSTRPFSRLPWLQICKQSITQQLSWNFLCENSDLNILKR
ncbi:unnamed protein product, partial [Cladocopium goreaui]